MALTVFDGVIKEADLSPGQAVYEAVMTPFTEYPIDMVHDIYDRIDPKGQQIGVASDVDDVTAAPNCTATDTGSGDLTLTEVDLVPTPLAIRKSVCHTEVRKMAGFQSKWSKTEPWDLTNTPEFINFYTSFYMPGFVMDAMRYAWLGDTAAAVDGSGGYLKAGLSGNLAKYNLMDGYWKKIIAGGGAITRVTLSKNALLTTALQMAYTGAEIIGFLDEAFAKADYRLQRKAMRGEAFYLVTQTWWVAVRTYFKNAGVTATGVEIVNNDIFVGGVKLIPMPFWDFYIGNTSITGDTSTASGAAKYYPNRFLLAAAEALPMGFSYDPQMPISRVWFNTDDEKVRFRAQNGIAVELGYTKLMVAGY